MEVKLMQIDIAFGEPEKNFQHVRDLFEETTFKKNQLVILPEMWNTAYDLTRLAEIVDEEGARTRVLAEELAKKYQIYLVAGSIARKSEGNFFNTTYTFAPDGKLLSSYDKVHLFGLMAEDKYLAAGDHSGHFSWEGVKTSTVICYDLRFPEWFRKQAAEGTQLFIVPAQWPEVRIEAWKKLLQARAIENQAFVIGVNRVGDDPSNHFNGHSLVVDPLGNILLELKETEECKDATLDFSEIAAVRKNIPVFQDRRVDLYY